MKHSLFFAACFGLLLSLPGKAQFTISSNEFPLAGYEAGKAFTSAPTAALGTSGGPQFFDLFSVVPLYHDSVRYYDPAQTPWGIYHPGSAACSAELLGDTWWIWYYQSDGNAFYKSGVTVIGDFSQGWDTVHGSFSLPDTLLSTAYTYGHQETEKAFALISNIVPLADYHLNIRKEIEADAWGSLQTPLNLYGDVIRVKYREYRNDTLFFLTTPVYTFVDTTWYYQFFAQGERHPVLKAYTDSLYNLLYLEYLFTPPVISGCTDPMAQNYNPLATADNGSCQYCSISFTITPDTVICAGNSITLSVTGGSSWLWNTGDTGASITVSPSQSTVYSVYVSSGPDCHAPASVSVKVDRPVSAGFWTIHNTYGTGQPIQFVNTSHEADWYLWDFDDPSDPSDTAEFPTHIYQDTGTRSIMLMAGNTCFSDTAWGTLYIVDGTGITEAGSASRLILSPVPACDYLRIQSTEPASGTWQLSILDLRGRCIISEVYQATGGPFSLDIPVTELTPGLYFIHLSHPDHQISAGFIKQ